MMQWLYTGVGMATLQRGGNFHNEIENFNVLAESSEAAHGWALNLLQEKFPSSAGYTYSLRLFEMDPRLIASWYEETRWQR